MDGLIVIGIATAHAKPYLDVSLFTHFVFLFCQKHIFDRHPPRFSIGNDLR